jgi:hypothetical protein
MILSLGSSRPRSVRGLRQQTWLRPWCRQPSGLARPLASVPCTGVGQREPCQSSSPARPRWHLRGSVPRLDPGRRSGRNRRQDANPVTHARRALSTANTGDLRHFVRHPRQSRGSRPCWHGLRKLTGGPLDALDSWIFVPECRGVGAPSRQVRGRRAGTRTFRGIRNGVNCVLFSPRSATRHRLQPWASPRVSTIFISWSSALRLA